MYVQALCPGIVRTEFHAVAGHDLSMLPPQAFASPEDIVGASLAGLRLGETLCLPTVSDVAVLAASQASQRAVLDHGRIAPIAPRYAD